jgi:hypothetical protein
MKAIAGPGVQYLKVRQEGEGEVKDVVGVDEAEVRVQAGGKSRLYKQCIV